ncbi:type I-E CRISPR-associated endoribonuclease Cas2e [Streptomyces sp. NPDC048281]|uniref:type I-E CRISPR-associated endoribonuclease Cas2e n=1 Tax=Streptomyces sp. NPDC048281 TaxID=3154715 RepID=UPI003418208E
MPSMLVLATTAVPDHLRGALSRWTIEVVPGIFVGTVSARVRDELWNAVTEVVADGAAVLVHPAPTEQGYKIRTAGTRRRVPMDFDGLTLMRMTAAPPPPNQVKRMQGRG